MTVDKKSQIKDSAQAGWIGSTSDKKDKIYLATVQIRFSDSKETPPVRFDVQKDKKALIAARLFETEETTTILHLGYSDHVTNPSVGIRFTWHF